MSISQQLLNSYLSTYILIEKQIEHEKQVEKTINKKPTEDKLISLKHAVAFFRYKNQVGEEGSSQDEKVKQYKSK